MDKPYSPTYYALLDLLFKTKTTRKMMHQSIQNNGNYTSKPVGMASSRLDQDFYIAASELWEMCTPNEYYLTGRISSELKSYNAIWVCDPSIKMNGTTVKSLAGLVKKKVLIRTETTNIFLVNPVYMRRGDFSAVVNTTASLLSGVHAVSTLHYKNCRQVKEFDASFDFLQIDNQ